MLLLWRTYVEQIAIEYGIYAMHETTKQMPKNNTRTETEEKQKKKERKTQREFQNHF